tara:strand:+ start:46 stop:306 length:261 start_codon:yes stop_codon:yes gene_type:complete
MGKAKRATRKELEDVIGKMIQELSALRNHLGMYIEWKGDMIEYSEHLKRRFEKPQKEASARTVTITGGDTKSEKKDRYKKISTPPL